MPVSIRTLTRDTTLVKYRCLDKEVQPKALEEARLYLDNLVTLASSRAKRAMATGANSDHALVRQDILDKTIEVRDKAEDETYLVKLLEDEYIWFLETGILVHRG